MAILAGDTNLSRQTTTTTTTTTHIDMHAVSEIANIESGASCRHQWRVVAGQKAASWLKHMNMNTSSMSGYLRIIHNANIHTQK